VRAGSGSPAVQDGILAGPACSPVDYPGKRTCLLACQLSARVELVTLRQGRLDLRRIAFDIPAGIREQPGQGLAHAGVVSFVRLEKMLDQRLASDRILLPGDHLRRGDLHLVVHVVEKRQHRGRDVRRLVRGESVQEQDLLFRNPAVLAADLACHFDQELHDLRLRQQAVQGAQRPGDLVAAGDEARHRAQRDVAGLRDQGEYSRFLLVVGDPRIHPERVAQEQCLDGGFGLQRAELLDGALAVFGGTELGTRLLLQATDLAFRSAHPEHVEPSHGALLQHDVLAHVVFVQLLEEGSRLARLGRVLRQHDLENGVQVTPRRTGCAASERREPSPAQAQLAAALRAGWDLQLHRPLEGGRRDLCTGERLGRRDGKVDQQIAPLHAHGRVLPNRDAQVEVAGFAAALAGPALPGEPYARAGLHARGNLHLQARSLGDGGLSAATGAGFADGTLSPAARTRRAEDAAHEDLARTAALRAGLRPAAGTCPGALAFGATYRPVDGDFPLGAQHRVAQVHLDGCLDVFAGYRLGCRTPAPRAPALANQVFEHRAQVRGIESAACEILEAAEVAPAKAAGARLPLELARLLLVESRTR